jgi:hypothetical protein
VALGQLTLDLFERAAEFMQRLPRYADSIVSDRDSYDPTAHPAPHAHRAAVGGEFYGVGKKLERDLL